jgi:hypothetical protein
MYEDRTYLSFDMLSSKSVYDPLIIGNIQTIFGRVAPQWCSELYVVEDSEEMENGLRVEMSDPDSLYTILQQEARKTDQFRQRAWENTAKLVRESGKTFPPYDPKRLSGNWVITDNRQDLMVFLSYDNNPNLLEQNRLGAHCYSGVFEAIRSEVFFQSLFSQIVKEMPIDYGHAQNTAEWDSRNQNSKGNCIGINWKQHLPGLYWLNYFGEVYCDFIGRKKLLSAPGKWIKELRNGVIVALGDSPNEWDSPEYRERYAAVEAHLGKEFFFDIRDPKRKTRAPEFFKAKGRPSM